eukprot:TRINITY_DN288_c0_g1_i1.p1 TRINITY_DN288_c0_g1~~TRINITY_DN288_c0_g1_i1.p1  ORF type:complete len:504 (+),score=11.29 TRINITY_DN288_c0_g1_i1:304-1815(+)
MSQSISINIRHPAYQAKDIRLRLSPEGSVDTLANQAATQLQLKEGSVRLTAPDGSIEALTDESTLVAFEEQPRPEGCQGELDLGFVAPAAEGQTPPHLRNPIPPIALDLQSDDMNGWGETTVMLDAPWHNQNGSWPPYEPEPVWQNVYVPAMMTPVPTSPEMVPVEPWPHATISRQRADHVDRYIQQPAVRYIHPSVGYVMHIDETTRAEVFQLGVCGAPGPMLWDMVTYIVPGTRLFLWEPKTKTVSGPLIASECPSESIVRGAFGGRFPAQVKFHYMAWFSTVRYKHRLKIGAVTPDLSFFLEQSLASAQHRPQPRHNSQKPKRKARSKKETRPKAQDTRPKAPRVPQNFRHVIEIDSGIWQAVIGDHSVNQLSSGLRAQGYAVHVRLHRSECKCELSSVDQAGLDLAVPIVLDAQKRVLASTEGPLSTLASMKHHVSANTTSEGDTYEGDTSVTESEESEDLSRQLNNVHLEKPPQVASDQGDQVQTERAANTDVSHSLI